MKINYTHAGIALAVGVIAGVIVVNRGYLLNVPFGTIGMPQTIKDELKKLGAIK